MMNDFKKCISSSEIKHRIQSFANVLNQAYKKKDAIIIGVLKGSICFLSDLIRELTFSFTIEFIQAKSYGMGGAKAKALKIGAFDFDVTNQNVILLDDIFDRGLTLCKIHQNLLEKTPKSIKSVVLLKKNKKSFSDFQPDHFLFEVEDKFVVGYGLDYKEKYRGLKDICTID